MGVAADKSCIQYKLLGVSKGPAYTRIKDAMR